jgi:two-component sensor histidine kinase
LRDVVMAELAPHTTGDGANVTVDGPPVMLKPQAALLFALVVHELSTNAAKYGALSVDGAKIDVSWTIVGDDPPRLDFCWTEAGGPKIERLPRRGFGSELIERGIRFELQGEAKLEAADGSVRCRIIIPADPEHLVFRSPPDRKRIEEAAS